MSSFDVNLEWNKPKQDARFQRIQKFVDSECIRYMKPLTPMKTGMMMKSATLGTVIGSGHIEYNSPYARYQYYGVVYGPNIPITENGELVGFFSPPKKHPTGRMLEYSKVKHPEAQRLWFEVMKKKYKPIIQKGIAALEKGGSK